MAERRSKRAEKGGSAPPAILVEKQRGLGRKLVSTGSTLLNLALSDDPYGGFVPGKIVNIIGDQSSGKTFLLWTLFAEAIYSGLFDDYKFINDEPEQALEIDIVKLFGKKIEEKVQQNTISDTIEDFHDNVMEMSGEGEPFIYGLDSFDALTSIAELKRDIRDGTYGMEKPKLSGEILRKIVGRISDSESLVVVISQTRDKIGATFGPQKTRAGGKALHFYCTHELWLAVKSHIKRKDRDVGVNVIVKISKNKFTGKLRTVSFDILYDYGIDCIGSQIDWLVEEKFWGKPSGKRVIETKGDFIDATREKLIEHIENNNFKDKLIQIVAKRWKEIEESIATDRRGKYAGA